ncbi:mechanosensitive ion channel family protein [Parasedimentitalea marina]|uniref:Mechanosensitive ion channel family protein n=1 Tax=Parasedimentitalea marina TaxID=2483033 RepID=A0A3T0MYQ9_9RHOB|nr:mechanosensitive ion channel domain-containing protein [Parasedimentitalea marina]AZV76882.1 mechanosensitive ion channel family protein [Parasedimentitalea marina]
MTHLFFRFLLSGLLALMLAIPMASPLAAQSEDSAGAEALANAIEQAADSGVGVIVLNGRGQLVGDAADSDPAEGSVDPMGGPSALMQAQSEVDKFRKELSSRLAALPYSVFEVKYILRQTSPDGRIQTYLEILGWNVLLLLIGRWLSVEIYGKRIAKGLVTARIMVAPKGYREKMPFLVLRFFMGLGATVFAMIFAALAGYLIFGPAEDDSVKFTITAVFTAYFLASTVSDLWRMVLSPYLSQYRIPAFSDRDAKRLYLWASLLATYDISSILFATWVGDFGLNYNVYAMVHGVLTLVATIGNLAMVLFNARAITNAIRAGKGKSECSWLVQGLSTIWAPLVMAYMAFGWLNLAFDLVLEREASIPLMAGTYMVLTSVLIVYGVINYVIERFFDRSRRVMQLNEEMAETEPGTEAGEQELSLQSRQSIITFEDLARRVAGLLAFVVGAYSLIIIWNPDAAWMDSVASERVIDVISILFIGYVVYHLFRIWIDSKIAEETGDVDEGELGDEGGANGASRLATLLPLFRGAILAVVVVSIGLIVLLELGINVSPLFAGAGVVGLAIGFGSQTLVRDIFSGAFFLVDDAFRKGEYIDIGDVKGTVEKISVRSFQLRHHLGALQTIPFGEIRVLTNYSRDWVIMKLPLRVTYDTDVEKVRKMIKNLGKELLKDPVIGDNFIQPLKSQGVIEMQDSAMIIRVKFMTKPGDQWLVRKKVYEEIRQLFEREGIRFAHREVTVRLADGKSEDLNPQQKEAVTGAVQAAIDEDFLEESGGGDDR